jgi:peptidoglycan hydrolase CwlO-like protein
MTFEVSVIISFVSVAFAVFFGLSNRKRADTTDIEVKAKERAETNIKLDNIGKDVTDIKYDISVTRKEVKCLSDRMIMVEQSVKSAHHRIDGVEEKKDN